jgi:AraC-like DNA-binding protein
VFTAHAGQGFRSYLRQLRLSNAAELLVGTSLSMGEIADAVGYADASQFAKAFRRVYGVSPSRYRAMPHEPQHEMGALNPAQSVNGHPLGVADHRNEVNAHGCGTGAENAVIE